MHGIPSLLRLSEYKALSRIVLEGKVLDLGGEKRSGYHNLFKGTFETTVINLNPEVLPDIVHDLEQPLPVASSSFDHVLLINVLEHVFEYRGLLREAARVLVPQGSIVVVVPFLFPIHPSPEDYRRFTASALLRELESAGFKDISIVALGGGVFSARYVLIDRLLPYPLRFAFFYSCRYVVYALDALLYALARALKRKYDTKDYALGYCATAKKLP